jgi:16S rRNA (uracil1498-N3)-methyltransferase
MHVSQPLGTNESIDLDPSQAHHVRDVLRLGVGDAVELFDDAGAVANAVLVHCDPAHVSVRIECVQTRPSAVQIVVASAIPKGDRADWMIEKLSELGVSRFIPLAAARSVVLPTGQNKRDRWIRIATESAKQSRRAGVMQIDELTSVEKVVEGQRAEGRGENRSGGQKAEGKGQNSTNLAIYLSTAPEAPPISSFRLPASSFLLIGPEGGWTPDEIALFQSHHLTGVKLTATILRVETAAVAAAAVVACSLQSQG